MAEYPYGYCGMPCALCTRYRTDGSSRCPGCSDDGYYTEPCRVHRCCREKGLAHCGSCGAFPCPRLGKMSDFRDLNTGNVKRRTCEAVRISGLDAWRAEYAERAELLTAALERYNNGRMKRLLCELFIRRDIGTLRALMRQAEGICGDRKERGAAFLRLMDALPPLDPPDGAPDRAAPNGQA